MLLTKPIGTQYPGSEQGVPIPTPSDYGASGQRTGVQDWSVYGDSIANTAITPTSALRQSSLEPETRTLSQIIGEDTRKRDAWDKHTEDSAHGPPDIGRPPLGRLLLPIRYMHTRDPKDLHTVEDSTCQMTLDVANALFRLQVDDDGQIIGRDLITRYDDDETRESLAYASLHSMRNGGLQGARFWDRGTIEYRHKGMMKSLNAWESGKIDKSEYRVTVGIETVEGRTVHSVLGESLLPDTKGEFYSVNLEFVDNGTAPYLASEGWLADV